MKFQNLQISRQNYIFQVGTVDTPEPARRSDIAPRPPRTRSPSHSAGRAALCSASLRHRDLDTGVLEAILETTFLPEVLKFNLHKHLRFSFLRPGCDERAAVEQLLELIRTLAESGHLEAKERMLNAEMIAAAVADDLEAYETVAAEFAELRKYKQSAIERFRELNEMAALAIAA